MKLIRGTPPRTPKLAAMTIRRTALLSLTLATLSACGNYKTVADPLSDLQNPKLGIQAKSRAIDQAWSMATDGKLDRTAVREDLKTIAWSRHWTPSLRVQAITALLSDTDPAGQSDTRNMLRLMLPREPEPQIIALISDTAAARGWTEMLPALVRSLSQPQPIPDTERREAIAINKLSPDRPLERVVYDLFLNPPDEGGAFGLVPAERIRMDAWNLLSRLDRDGSLRLKLLADEPDTPGPASDTRAALRDLRVIPVTGEELQWVSSLHSAANQSWWEQTREAVFRLDRPRTGNLQVRNLEPIRWASIYRTSWIASTRDQLFTELSTRLEGRKFQRRSNREEFRKYPSESLRDWQGKLSWADLLSILVIDEALKQRELIVALFAQTDMDRDDKTAEYGGLLRTGPESQSKETENKAPATFAAVLFPPRPGSRKGDREFVASSDMLEQGDLALAHYHFHVQDSHNSEFAGPSMGDLDYARRYGRTCIVFTSVASDILDADLYTPDGAVIDLGYLNKP